MSDFDKPPSLLIVCIGNTCRSPMAEAFAKRQWPSWVIRSAGLSVTQRRPAEGAIRAMRELGLDIETHQPTPITDIDLSDFHALLVLDRAVSQAMVRDFDVPKAKIIDLYVDDPFGDDEQEYLACARIIRNRLNGMAAEIESAIRR